MKSTTSTPETTLVKLDADSLKNLKYGDKFVCRMHGKVVRFSRWIDETAAEVMTSDTCEILPDWTHIAHMYRWAQIR